MAEAPPEAEETKAFMLLHEHVTPERFHLVFSPANELQRQAPSLLETQVRKSFIEIEYMAHGACSDKDARDRHELVNANRSPASHCHVLRTACFSRNTAHKRASASAAGAWRTFAET